MTAHKDLKQIIRERQSKTGESYTAARVHVMRERATLLGLETQEPFARQNSAPEPLRAEALVIKVNRLSARGRMENPHLAVEKLGLTPLPLHEGRLEDLRSAYEPYERPDPYALLWDTLTARPRIGFRMDPIAWGQFPDSDPEDDPTCDASELARRGDYQGAREILMGLLGKDLRCIDAHAHLGNLEFDHSVERAAAHYEVGIRIGELFLPPNFDGVLLWGRIYNRPFLRCLHGLGLCLWRMGKLTEAQQVFERILSLNPNDNQGVRFCWDDVRQGRSWEDAQRGEPRELGLH